MVFACYCPNVPRQIIQYIAELAVTQGWKVKTLT